MQKALEFSHKPFMWVPNDHAYHNAPNEWVSQELFLFDLMSKLL